MDFAIQKMVCGFQGLNRLTRILGLIDKMK